MSLRRRVLATLAIAGGVALLVWQVRVVGAAEIGRGVASIGWIGAVAVAALSAGRFVARAAAWVTLLGGGVPISRALAAFVAGDAAGNLTPLGLFASEPAKVAYLAGPGDRSRALAALTVENYFFAISVAIYVMAGAAALLMSFPIDATLRTAGMAALAGMTVVLAGAAWLAWRQPAAASAFVSRLAGRKLASIVEQLRAFEITLYGTVGPGAARVWPVGVAAVAFHALSFLETWVVLYLLTGESLLIAAFVLDTVSRVANVLFKMIPFQLGVLQVGSEVVARAVGLGPGVGVALSLIRTARVMAWAAVGIGLMGARIKKSRSGLVS